MQAGIKLVPILGKEEMRTIFLLLVILYFAIGILYHDSGAGSLQNSGPGIQNHSAGDSLPKSNAAELIANAKGNA